MTGKMAVDTDGAAAVWQQGVGVARTRLAASFAVPELPGATGALATALDAAAEDLRRSRVAAHSCLTELDSAFRSAMAQHTGHEAARARTLRAVGAPS